MSTRIKWMDLSCWSATVAARWTAKSVSVRWTWIQLKVPSWPLQLAVSLTFDVSVYNHVAVQVGDSLEDLPGVSPGHLLRQGAVGFQLVLYWALGRWKWEMSERRRGTGGEMFLWSSCWLQRELILLLQLQNIKRHKGAACLRQSNIVCHSWHSSNALFCHWLIHWLQFLSEVRSHWPHQKWRGFTSLRFLNSYCETKLSLKALNNA